MKRIEHYYALATYEKGESPRCCRTSCSGTRSSYRVADLSLVTRRPLPCLILQMSAVFSLIDFNGPGPFSCLRAFMDTALHRCILLCFSFFSFVAIGLLHVRGVAVFSVCWDACLSLCCNACGVAF